MHAYSILSQGSVRGTFCWRFSYVRLAKLRDNVRAKLTTQPFPFISFLGSTLNQPIVTVAPRCRALIPLPFQEPHPCARAIPALEQFLDAGAEAQRQSDTTMLTAGSRDPID